MFAIAQGNLTKIIIINDLKKNYYTEFYYAARQEGFDYSLDKLVRSAFDNWEPLDITGLPELVMGGQALAWYVHTTDDPQGQGKTTNVYELHFLRVCSYTERNHNLY